MKILIKGGLRFSTLTDDDKPVVSLETKGMDMSVCSVKNCENFNQKRFEDSFQLTISLWFTRSKRNRYVRPPQNKFRIFENQIRDPKAPTLFPPQTRHRQNKHRRRGSCLRPKLQHSNADVDENLNRAFLH